MDVSGTKCITLRGNKPICSNTELSGCARSQFGHHTLIPLQAVMEIRWALHSSPPSQGKANTEILG